MRRSGYQELDGSSSPGPSCLSPLVRRWASWSTPQRVGAAGGAFLLLFVLVLVAILAISLPSLSDGSDGAVVYVLECPYSDWTGWRLPEDSPVPKHYRVNLNVTTLYAGATVAGEALLTFRAGAQAQTSCAMLSVGETLSIASVEVRDSSGNVVENSGFTVVREREMMLVELKEFEGAVPVGGRDREDFV